MTTDLKFRPLAPDTWQDLQTLFENDRVCQACWCMWWRLSASDWLRQRGRDNREALKALMKSGKRLGILAYSGDKPVGWCSVSPRHEYPRLERSRTLRRIDDKPVWSTVCFFVAKPFRRQGVSAKLLKAAVSYAGNHGAEIVEGYPNKSTAKQQDPLLYTGTISIFRKAGFTEAPTNSKTRTIMRYALKTKTDSSNI
jgi:GNAT superfamily N-acetyltransferase